MEKDSRAGGADSPLFLGEAWFDPIETGVRGRVRGFIEVLVEEELNGALGLTHYQCLGPSAGTGVALTADGYWHGQRPLLGSLGTVTITASRARLTNADGTSGECRSGVLRATSGCGRR